MKKFTVLSAIVGMVVLVLVSFFTKNEQTTFSQCVLSNVEALTNVEQPNVNECVLDKRYDCVALHPTDPNKDIKKEGYRWPEK